jgi:hypothetical protein
MPRTKRTIARDSVLRRPAAGAESQVQQGLPEGSQSTRQTALWLSDEELEWLDSHVRDIRRGGWRGITRSALTRAIIHAMMDQRMELSGVSGEAELVDLIKGAVTQ